MVKRAPTSIKKVKDETTKRARKSHRRSKKFKKVKEPVEQKPFVMNENFMLNDKSLEVNDINEYINGNEILNRFISDSNKDEMTFIKLPFHVNLIRKRNTGYTKYTKIYRKRMKKLIGFGNRFGPHYHKDENGHIYSMEYTDRITSKSLIFFRCQLKGCKAKGVLNSTTKKFIVNQKHALPYENHIPNKKSSIKILIEKTFAEKPNIKDIQIIFCIFNEEMKNKQKLSSLNNTNFNIILDNNNFTNLKDKKIKRLENDNNDMLDQKEEEKFKKESNKILVNINNTNNKLVKREIDRSGIFLDFYNEKYNKGENIYDDYFYRVFYTNRENMRETKECFYEVEVNINDYKYNKKFLYNFEDNKYYGSRYHINLNKEIFIYAFEKYDEAKKQIIFLCKYEGCTGKAYYDQKTKKFIIAVPHLICYKNHFDNLYCKIDNYEKVTKIFNYLPEITDIQFILKDKKF